MRIIIAFLAILLIFVSVYLGLSHINFVKQKRIAKNKNIEQTELVHKFYKNVEERLNDKEIDKLPEDTRRKARLINNFKQAVSSFEEAEDYLARAVSLRSAISPDDTNPLIESYFQQSMASYKKAKEIIDRLEEIEGDDKYNHCLHYTKGEIYYRVLQFIAVDEEKIEIFNQTVQSFKKALLAKPRDIDTEINVEILITNRSQLLTRATMPTGQMLRQLPQKSAGQGIRKGKF